MGRGNVAPVVFSAKKWMGDVACFLFRVKSGWAAPPVVFFGGKTGGATPPCGFFGENCSRATSPALFFAENEARRHRPTTFFDEKYRRATLPLLKNRRKKSKGEAMMNVFWRERGSARVLGSRHALSNGTIEQAGPGEKPSEREIHVHQVVKVDSNWYFFAYIPAENKMKTFFSSRRIQSLVRTGKKFQRQKFDVKEHLRTSFGIRTSDKLYKVRILCSPKIADYIREKIWPVD